MSGEFSSGMVFAIPLIFIPVIYLLRRWWVGGWLAILLALSTAFLVTRYAPTEPVNLFGRTLVTDALWTNTVTLLFLALAGLFTLSLSVPQGWTFYPVGLAVIATVSLALAVPHPGIAALLVEIAVLLTIFVIQGGRLGSVRAAQRFLVMFTLAVPLFLLVARHLDAFHDNFDDPAFLAQIALLSAGGFALWLGIAPLHGWISAIAREAQPGIAAFSFIVFPTAAIFLMLRLLESSPWLTSVAHTRDVLLWGGALSVLVGGIFASVQISFSPLMGYAVLFDLGTLVMAFGLQNRMGIAAILFGLAGRMVALVLLGNTTAILNHAARTESFAAMRGLGRKFPVATAGLMIGAATLAGAPLTAGFITRWLTVQSLAPLDTRLPLLLLIGSLGVTIGYVRGLWALIAIPEKGSVIATPPVMSLNRAVIIILCGVSLWWGLFPEKLLTLAQTLARGVF